MPTTLTSTESARRSPSEIDRRKILEVLAASAAFALQSNSRYCSGFECFPYWSISTIAVQTLGGRPPIWTSRVGREPPLFEIVITRAKGVIDNAIGVDPRFRFLLSDDRLRVLAPPPCAFSIQAAADDLDPIAEALARVLAGDAFVGADLADLWALRSAPSMDRARGFALEWSGWDANALAAAVRRGRRAMAEAGCDGGTFVSVLVGRRHTPAFTLYDLDDFLTAAIDRSGDVVATGSFDASRSAIVVVGFPARRQAGAWF